MTDPKGTWSDGGKVWEGEPQALAATRNVLAMTTDENLHAGQDGLRDCLQSIADISEEEPREPDDADWRFRCLEAIRAAKTTLAALPASPLRGRIDIARIIDPDAKWGEVIEAGSDDDNQIMLALEKADAILSTSPPEQPAADPVTGRLADAAIHILNTFRKDEADGFRSRDRQFAITLLEQVLSPDKGEK